MTLVDGMPFMVVMRGLYPFVDGGMLEPRRDVYRSGVLVDQQPLSVGEPFHVAVRVTHLHDSRGAAALVVSNGGHDESDGTGGRNKQPGYCQDREA